MSLIQRVQERRLVQFVVTYLAAGWVGLEVIGSFVERQVLPEFVFTLGLVWYLAGIPIALLIGWYHGERGNQKAPKWEVTVIIIVILSLAGFSVTQVRQHGAERQAIPIEADGELDPRQVAVSHFGATEDTLRPVADALSENLIRTLAGVPTLDAVSVNAVLPFPGTTTPPDSSARAFGAGSVATGTIRAESDGIRLEIRLIDSPSGTEYGKASLLRDWDDVQDGAPALIEELAAFLRSRMGEAIERVASHGEVETRGG